MAKLNKSVWQVYHTSIKQRFWNLIKNFEKRYKLPKLYGEQGFQVRTKRYQCFQQVKSDPKTREALLSRLQEVNDMEQVIDVCNKNKMQ